MLFKAKIVLTRPKSLNQPVTTGWLSRHTTFESSRTLRHDTMLLKCAVPWERALFGRRQEGAIFDSFDEFHHYPASRGYIFVPRKCSLCSQGISPSKVCCKTLCYKRTGSGQSFTETCKGKESSNHF